MKEDNSSDFRIPNKEQNDGHGAESGKDIPPNTLDLFESLRRLGEKSKIEHKGRFFEVQGAHGEHAVLLRAYESIRNSIEYSEEHLLMRGAIYRYLQRQFGKHPGSELVEGLLSELIFAGYVENHSVPIPEVDKIGELLLDYQQLAEKISFGNRSEFETYLGIISSHIQDELLDSERLIAIINYMYTYCYDAFGDTKNLPLPMYIAVERTLFKSDDAVISSRLFRSAFGQYIGEQSDYVASEFNNFVASYKSAKQSKLHAYASSFVRRESASLLVLVDVLNTDENPQDLVMPNYLDAEVKKSAEKLYNEAVVYLEKGIVRSIIFLFITKTIIGIAIEIPYGLWTEGHIKFVPLLINLLFPPLYLLVAGAVTTRPDNKNTESIREQIKLILYNKTVNSEYSKNIETGNSKSRSVFNFLYTMLSFGLFLGIVYILALLEFNIVEVLIFFVFFSSVSFFAFRVTHAMRELKVYSMRDDNVLQGLLAVLTTPFVRAGQWLSARYQGINIFVFIFDFLIEAQFKSVVMMVRRWRVYLREKQDETL